MPGPPLLLYLKKAGTSSTLQLADSKGRPADSEYRRYTGDARIALREYALLMHRQQEQINWTSEEPLPEGLQYPGPRILQLAARSGLLCDSTGKLLNLAPGTYYLELSIREGKGEALTIRPRLVAGAEGDPEVLSRVSEAPFHSVSASHIMAGEYLFCCEDLGSYWAEADFLGSTINKTDLGIFLSITLSRFPLLKVDFQQCETVYGKPRTLRAALVFQEIDAYNYLHLQPVSTLDGYPPGFFEEQDILKIAEIHYQERHLEIAEIIYADSPQERFLAILKKFRKDAEKHVHAENGRYILPPEFAEPFLSEHMTDLARDFELFHAETLKRYRIRYAKPKLRLSLGSGLDYFEGRAAVEVDGQEFSYGHFLNEYRQSGYVKLDNGDKLFPEKREMDRFTRVLNRKPSGTDDEVHLSFFDLAMLDITAGVEAPPDLMNRIRSFYRNLNSLNETPATFPLHQGSLREYQKYGVQWLQHLREHRLGGCLADDMGLGKTVQVIALLRVLYSGDPYGPTLIICPKSLLYNWELEIQRFAPELPVHMYYGPGRTSQEISETWNGIILSTYATIRNDITSLQEICFSSIILDESQAIKNTAAMTTIAVLSLKGDHRIALSGTPVENHLGELYSLFRFLNPSFFGSENHFMKTWAKPIQEKDDADALQDLKTRIYPYILRRLKRDVLKDLPEKTEQTALIELDSAHLATYHRRRKMLSEGIQGEIRKNGMHKSMFMILQALNELRRLASIPEADAEYGGISAKREYLLDMISEISETGHKSLIFTNHLTAVELISEDLNSRNIGNLVMTGATSGRQELVQRFQSDPDIAAFVMTLKTGGTGLNLTAADYVFIVDPWWNQAAENQAIDRTHRIGQVNPVFCYRMIAKETIEEKILQLQKRKSQLTASLFSADSDGIKSLTENDIAFLME
ncbi:Superfamily II DNA or RNA helicase, SNF2 family [Alkalispirochaeta americana]|uniref:Superfamily II DNA or RNA helicase, SNF2 family n=1 Tax=Alkalispirochaeta americana TaxID=159291 RepID=A0A1N6SLD0_9SPIO|nr:DEAD/DEAH box helicase [Alkalispirochaeta americana]SIQ41869.1 Superfamily II DNA or RNA helicase, SNF2 family [Alkalispirochaeta americana]